MAPRIVIVGAGVAGLTTALELRRRTTSAITVLDRGGPGFGSSSRSAGVVETQYMSATDIATRSFGLRYFEDFATRYGTTLVRDGYLRLGATEADLDRFRDSVALQAELGITGPAVLTRAEVERRWPRLRLDGRAGALYGPADGHVDSYEFCLRAAAVLVSQGVTLRSGVTVTAADHDSSGWILRTTAGPIGADLVINAAGPWATQLGELLGAPVPVENQLRPKVKLTHTEALDQLVPFVMDYVPGSGTDGVYFRSETPHELFVGIHTEENLEDPYDPDALLPEAPAAFVERALSLLPERLRVPAGLEVGPTWTGLYPMTPDGNPIAGPHPADPTVGLVIGGGGNGVQLAPAMARHLVDQMEGAEPTFPDLDWSLTRKDLA
ncbi:FAD-binding oxidoreductase [Actinoplanes bogorensis]|uniref:FAD-binding oxidoreductase n=1 Tax=Paractinoplanes bogorensis TaxID=1610840 RepID=A0ABS5YXA6_9ACTN|nr:FAD-binding oxidoreductase [Actinoplanes bogorensis]MBU2668079.1 FAD-binding oxidoreductase [Actinoplanes bogorensis]